MGVEAAKHVQFDHDRLSVVIPKNTWVNIEFQKVKDPSSELIIYQPSVVAPNGQKLNSTRVQVASMDHDLAQSLEERRRSVDFLASQCESEGLDVDRDDLLRQINQAAEDDDEMLSKIAGLFCFLPERGGLYQLRLGVVNPMTDKF
ncbi:MAG: hypothetical protein Q7S88_00820, partial [Candidatus Daviesbacteria bacterium]|nr:hypothetical protein [Candidatus Daviesbacteria bacterium]